MSEKKSESEIDGGRVRDRNKTLQRQIQRHRDMRKYKTMWQNEEIKERDRTHTQTDIQT